MKKAPFFEFLKEFLLYSWSGVAWGMLKFSWIKLLWKPKIHSQKKEVFGGPFGSHRFQIPFLMISGLYKYD